MIGGALQGRTEEQVYFVNAPSIAEERGIVVEGKSVTEAQDFNELIRVTVLAGGERVAVAGTGIGPSRAPHLGRGPGPAPDHRAGPVVTVVPPARIRPGMIGRVGHDLRRSRINISSAAVGHAPDGDDADGERRLAAMVVTTDAPVPEEVVQEIVASEGFVNGWSVQLGDAGAGHDERVRIE